MNSAAVPKPASETPPPSYEEALYRSDSDSRPLRPALHFPLFLRQSVRLPGAGPVTEEAQSPGATPVVTSEVRVEEAGNQSETSTPALDQSEEATAMVTASATVRWPM